MRSSRFLFSATALFTGMTATPVSAATWTVTSNAEATALDTSDSCIVAAVAPNCTLRSAINQAASGDQIVFSMAMDGLTIALSLFSNDLSPGSTEFGPSAFFITGGRTLTIDATANGLTRGVVVERDESAAAFRLFDVDSGSTLDLRGLRLRNGLAIGGSASYGGAALGAGGAIFNQGSLTLTRCTLDGNSARGGVGGADGSVKGGSGVGLAANSSVGGSPNGGAAGLNSGANGGDGGFGGDAGVGGGGGGGGAGNPTDGFGGFGGRGGFGGGGGGGGDGGSRGRGGGGFGGGGGSGGFGGDAGGGGLVGLGGFGGGDGGGLNSFGIRGGGGGGMGGAVFNDAGTVILTNVTLSANSASGGGSLSGNGSGFGGAVFNYSGTLTLDFVTLAGNSVAAGSGGVVGTGSANGGAIYSLGDASAACSAGGNPCPSNGTANLTMRHSIAANSSGGGNDVVVASIHAGTSNSGGSHNVIMANSGGFGGTVVINADPLLQALTSGGGLSAVMVPALGSPAINAANSCLTGNGAPVPIDQRGESRPYGAACDLGAVEVGPRLFRNGFEGDN